jgi:tetratricopeptide (TPR) repeat protein
MWAYASLVSATSRRPFYPEVSKQVSLRFFSYLVLSVFAVSLAPVQAAGLSPVIDAMQTRPTLSAGRPSAYTLMVLAKKEQTDEGKAETPAASESGAKKAPGKKAADKTPYTDEAMKHYNRGVELHQSGFLNQAISEYKAAIDADNRMEEAYSNLGVIYAAQRNYPRAKDAFSTALSLKPKRPTALNGLGTVLYAQGHVKEAKEMWLKVLAVDPKFASAYYNIGNACESEKSFGEALSIYAQAIAVAPTMADAYYRMGAIYCRQHHLPQGSLMLRRAIEIAPDGDFVAEAKKMQRNLEEDFAKNVSSGSHFSGSTRKDRESLKTPAEGDEAKPKPPGKKKKSGLDMFVQPVDEQAKPTSN